MPFRFFDRGAKPNANDQTAEQEIESAESEELEVEIDVDDVAPEDAERIDWSARARAVLPTGASTGSKRPSALYGAEDAAGPTHFIQAAGCRVIDTDGNEYIDCTMALGAVALGYAEPNVTRAAIDAVAHGNVAGLSSAREVDVAERLHGMIPCAEMVQFLKTGAEAITAAVRIARTYTGRDIVVGCGYFGWLDWNSDAAGVPDATRALYRAVKYDDIPSLEQAVSDAGNRLAAVVIEPVIERLPSVEWVARARALCDAHGAALIFDEIKTGFRLRTGGYQQYAEITPDLAAFGKAMANGFPLSAVVGKRDVMDAARRTWISSTLAGETSALAACGAVLDWHEQAEICESLWTTGAEMQNAVQAAITASGVAGVRIDGVEPMWLMRWDDPARERRFLELAATHGVLFKRGAYNYAAMAHDDDIIQAIESAASATFVDLVEEEAHE